MAVGIELPAAVELAVYRVAQEAVANVVRHAGAGRVRVRPESDEDQDEVRLEVADDGAGRVVPRPGGVGLISMRERAEQLGGTLELRSVPGAGTTVAIRVPATLAGAAADSEIVPEEAR